MAPLERDRQFYLRATAEEVAMLHILAERAGLSASDYVRRWLRREMAAEAAKWRQSLPRLDRAVLFELEDWGMPEEIGAVHTGLREAGVECTQTDVELAVRRL